MERRSQDFRGKEADSGRLIRENADAQSCKQHRLLAVVDFEAVDADHFREIETVHQDAAQVGILEVAAVKLCARQVAVGKVRADEAAAIEIRLAKAAVQQAAIIEGQFRHLGKIEIAAQHMNGGQAVARAADGSGKPGIFEVTAMGLALLEHRPFQAGILEQRGRQIAAAKGGFFQIGMGKVASRACLRIKDCAPGEGRIPQIASWKGHIHKAAILEGRLFQTGLHQPLFRQAAAFETKRRFRQVAPVDLRQIDILDTLTPRGQGQKILMRQNGKIGHSAALNVYLLFLLFWSGEVKMDSVYADGRAMIKIIIGWLIFLPKWEHF